MANIGKLAVRITANARELHAALDAGARRMRQFAGGVAGTFGRIAAFAYRGAAAVAAAATNVVQGFMSGIRGGLTALGGVAGGLIGAAFGPAGAAVGAAAGAALGAGVGGAIELLNRKFEELGQKIDAAAKNGRRLGVATEVMMGLEGAAGEAGISIEEMTKFLMKARTVVGGDLWEGLQKGADKVKAMQNQRGKVALVEGLFGAGGEKAAKMLTLFEGGGQGLRDAVRAYEQMGFAVNAMDASKVEAANDAMQRMRFAMTGIWNKIVVAWAPAIGTIAQAVGRLAPVFAFVGDVGARAVELWALPLTKVREKVIVPLIEKLTSGGGLAAAAKYVLGVMTRGIDALGSVLDAVAPVLVAVGEVAIAAVVEWGAKASDWLDGATRAFPSVEQVVVMAFRNIALAGAYAWDGIKFGAGAASLALGTVIVGFGKLVSFAGNAGVEMLAFGKGLVDMAANVQTAVVTGMKGALKAILDLVDGISGFADRMGDKIGGAAGAKLKAWGAGAAAGAEQLRGKIDAIDPAQNPMLEIQNRLNQKTEEMLVAADKWGAKVAIVGRDLEGWGKGLMDEFGESADAVNAFFDGIQVRHRNLEKNLPKLAPAMPDYHATAAAEKASAADVSIRARWAFQNEANKPEIELARQQNQKQGQMVELLKEVANKVGGGAVVLKMI